ncbi:MAG TPA: cob(I)yrinic acid a,c-diamide adenosyltransferase [Vicinamibacteria bacterium]|nr:cob(I)yrinic acid a,c-diamide adenosyltransferase [Vicinamibacteria bacterium]
MKVYTKTGDLGETSLLGGMRVPKDHPRVAAYGDVDETNAALGAVRAVAEERLASLLFTIQNDLFAIGARLADPTRQVTSRRVKTAVTAAHVRRLEKAIDAREERLPPLRSFVLPGGTPAAALLHQARTVCRRAERSVVTLARAADVDPRIVVYLNRLSDLLFVLARAENHRSGLGEDRW